MGGPAGPGESLYVGIFDVRQFNIRIQADGIDITGKLVRRNYELSEFAAPMPSAFTGKDRIEISLSTDSKEPLKFGFVEFR
jgi:hypothetical protein